MPELTVFISSPLEAEHVATIRAVAPSRVEVIHEPDLLPPIRYVADHTGLEGFTRTPEQQARWEAALGRADILWDLPPTREDLAATRRLKWIQGTSTGIGKPAMELGLHETDVLLTTARGVHAGPLAEFVFMSLLAHFRGLAALQAEQKAHRWIRTCNEEIAGRTLALIGAGDLARGTAKIARAFGMHVVAVTREAGKERAHSHLFDEVVGRDRLHEVLGRSDAVVVTLPHLPDTEKLIDAMALAAMKRGAALVNIGRGAVIDEAAMIEALRSGQLGFVALDVTTVEPLPADSPLWDMPNVLISPHSASTVTSENAKITELFCHNLRCFLDGDVGAMRNVLDKTLLY